MMSKHLDKNSLHHAYLIEGSRDEITQEVISFLKDIGINTEGSSDFINISLDSFKIEDARNLKSFSSEKSYTSNKKIFIISVNNFLLEAQNSLLKMFEEPIENTHFFIIMPDLNGLLKTFVSRFYLISLKSDAGNKNSNDEAEIFISLLHKDRIDFIKKLLKEEDVEDDEGNKILALESSRSKALQFLDSLEVVLHNRLPSDNSSVMIFEHIFKIREFLRMPGSSTKSLMESIVFVIPGFSK
ncbi:MAG: hypothetical protein WCP17_00620 [bacterium]